MYPRGKFFYLVGASGERGFRLASLFGALFCVLRGGLRGEPGIGLGPEGVIMEEARGVLGDGDLDGNRVGFGAPRISGGATGDSHFCGSANAVLVAGARAFPMALVIKLPSTPKMLA